MSVNLFHGWFTFATALFAAITGYCVFTLRRWDVAFVLFLLWFCLVLLEYWIQNREFEDWKRRVFQ
jgi:fatty acid desaturase